MRKSSIVRTHCRTYCSLIPLSCDCNVQLKLMKAVYGPCSFNQTYSNVTINSFKFYLVWNEQLKFSFVDVDWYTMLIFFFLLCFEQNVLEHYEWIRLKEYWISINFWMQDSTVDGRVSSWCYSYLLPTWGWTRGSTHPRSLFREPSFSRKLFNYSLSIRLN